MKKCIVAILLALSFGLSAFAADKTLTPVKGDTILAGDVLLAKVVITPSDPTEKMKYLYRMRKILIDKLNGMVGTDGYKTFHDKVFLPTLEEIHAEMAKLKGLSSVGVAPDVDISNPDNQAVVDAYVSEKALLSSTKTYDQDIKINNPIVNSGAPK